MIHHSLLQTRGVTIKVKMHACSTHERRASPPLDLGLADVRFIFFLASEVSMIQLNI